MVRVAVIDDDHDFTALVRTILAERGWDCVVCHQAADALACVRQEQPNVVLLDVRMDAPQAGWTILEALRADAATRSIPVVVCSAAVDEVRSHEAWLREHWVGILVKPFDLDEFYATVGQHLHDPV